MTWGVVLAAFAITTLGVVFCAVPIYCLVQALDLFGQLDRRASDNSRTVAAPFHRASPCGTSLRTMAFFDFKRSVFRAEWTMLC